MLSTLRSIIQEVNSAEDLNDALNIIVTRVRKAMQDLKKMAQDIRVDVQARKQG